MRVLLALGGNAMTSADGRARVDDQIAAARVAMTAVVDLIAEEVDVVITHGNGPQVGNLLVKNELAPGVVPPLPLDWCGAQTQATPRLVLMDALHGEKGWRRVVASPEPLEILDAPAVLALIRAGFVVVANGGGGIPHVRRPDGSLAGVEAVIDKDLGAALLARTVGADALVIATDVPNAVLRHGEPDAEPLGEVPVDRMRELAGAG